MDSKEGGMKLQVLGCSGGIGAGNRTTSLLLNDNLLIDAGTGVGDLGFDALVKIDHVFLTHAHLDHIACLPLLLDTVAGSRNRPVTVHATQATIEVLQRHIFNWQIWPDFSTIPDSANALLRYQVLETGDEVILPGVTIRALPALHTVPAVAYQLDSGTASVVFSGDTDDCTPFWESVNAIANLQTLIIETAFADHEETLARASRHFTPRRLLAALGQLRHQVDIRITHLKPADHEQIMLELLRDNGTNFAISRLQTGQIITF